MQAHQVKLDLTNPHVWACMHEMWRHAMGHDKAFVIPSEDGWAACRWVKGVGHVAIAWGDTRAESLLNGIKWVFSQESV